MTINLHQIKLRDLFDGYKNNDEDGVVGYHGRSTGQFLVTRTVIRFWTKTEKKRMS